MKYQKTWQGTLPNGEFLFQYDGNSSDTIKALIVTLQQSLDHLDKGLISE